MPKMPWLPEEIAVLKKYYREKSIRELTQILNRSYYAIAAKAKQLGLVGMSERFWTPEDEEKLRELYPYASEEKLLEAFPKRTLTAIIRKAQILGVKRRTIFKNQEEFNSYVKKLRELAEF